MTAPHPLFAEALGSGPAGRLALGTAPLATVFWGNDEAIAIDTASRALEAGVRLFDTAPFYGLGESEARLGVALAQGSPTTRVGGSRFMIASKVGRVLTDDGAGGRDAHFDFSGDAARRSLEASLERLGVDQVDIVHIHDPDEHVDEALSGCYPALVELREQRVIRAVSVGTNSVATARVMIERADLDCVLVAGRYSLLDQSAAGLIDECAARGIAYLAAGVFNSGVLASEAADAWYDYGPASPEVRAQVAELAAVCAGHGVPLRTAALHFALANPNVAMVVVGMARPVEVDDNLTAAATTVPPALWQELSERGLIGGLPTTGAGGETS